jgi:hypothetical protein
VHSSKELEDVAYCNVVRASKYSEDCKADVKAGREVEELEFGTVDMEEGAEKETAKAEGVALAAKCKPAVCDCADPSHQFLRPHHTTITTNHNMPKKFPPRNKTPVAPTKRLPKTPWPHLPTRKEGLITRRTARRPGVRHQNVL